MRAKGNWNRHQNVLIPVLCTTQICNSKNHGITNTIPDNLFDIPTVHLVVIGTVINEYHNTLIAFSSKAGIKCMLN